MLAHTQLLMLGAAVALCGSCSTVPQENSLSDPDPVAADRYEQYYAAWYDAVVSRFGEDRQILGPQHQRLSVLVHPTFDALIMLVIEKHPETTFEDALGLISLEPKTQLRIHVYTSEETWLRDFPEGKTIKENPKEFSHHAMTHDLYIKDISDTSFEAIYDGVIKSGILDESVSALEEGCATDGTRYFFEIVWQEKAKFFSRSDCSDEYAVDFEYAKPLIQFALEEIPQAEKHFSDEWLRATELSIDSNTK